MPWMRVSIGVGAVAVVAGVAGMIFWIHDVSNFFDLSVAVALTGFLTLICCVLMRVFGSSHGTQDDAFRRGRAMGYDAGFLEGRRTARPVVVPLRLVGRDPALVLHDYDSDSDHADDQDTPIPAAPMWRRDGVDWWDRGSGWVSGRRTVLLVGAVALGVTGVLTTSMLLPTSTSTVTSPPLSGTLFNGDATRSPATAELVTKVRAQTAVAAVAAVAAFTGGSSLAPSVAAGVAAAPTAGEAAAPAAGEAAGPAAGEAAVTAVAAAGVPSSPNSTSGAEVANPVTVYLPAVRRPVTVPVEPVVAAPVVPLTAAEQTAADAKAAADLTAANAKAAADLTAANAKAAADLTAANASAAAAETARVAAAAAEATRLQALADAYAVAHPGD